MHNIERFDAQNVVRRIEIWQSRPDPIRARLIESATTHPMTAAQSCRRRSIVLLHGLGGLERTSTILSIPCGCRRLRRRW